MAADGRACKEHIPHPLTKTLLPPLTQAGFLEHEIDVARVERARVAAGTDLAVAVRHARRQQARPSQPGAANEGGGQWWDALMRLELD